MLWFYFWPLTIIYPLLIIIETIIVLDLSSQLNPRETNPWKYTRVFLFVCLDIGAFLVLLDEVLSNIEPFVSDYTKWVRLDFVNYFGNYFLLTASLICVFLTMQLANVQKANKPPIKLSWSIALLWIPYLLAEIGWLVTPTATTELVRRCVQSFDIVAIAIIFLYYGGSLIHQLRESLSMSMRASPSGRQNKALIKICVMMIFDAILAVGMLLIGFLSANNLKWAVYGNFSLIVVFHVLYIVILGPGRIPLPKLQSFAPKFMTRDSLTDTFETSSTRTSVVSMNVENETALKTIHIEISESRANVENAHTPTAGAQQTVEIIDQRHLRTEQRAREPNVENVKNVAEICKVIQEGLEEEEEVGVQSEKSGNDDEILEKEGKSKTSSPKAIEGGEKSDLS